MSITLIIDKYELGTLETIRDYKGLLRIIIGHEIFFWQEFS